MARFETDPSRQVIKPEINATLGPLPGRRAADFAVLFSARVAAAAQASIQAGVLYGRSADPWMATAREILRSGKFGFLALYRQGQKRSRTGRYPDLANFGATFPVENGGFRR